ncbi:type III pantothenate kinase [Pseudomonas sp. 5P_3.1_Bac2]|uniref:type III pantothenate kinase n=1 Tax=Pseudomonas sp. 5P_3.1_Bac2 TaxID=2971617 RepID=UPI0021C7383D|nr:type III pantothenate kinase [Pseudomonas sp. 5P_3.1_Bac2]MCU1719282.1 type III pantothenate kinase [Pseudomonas sp. 5P_3.1_Bac2]
MILELDCGNTFIKWRLLGAAARLAGVAESVEQLLVQVREQGQRIRACRLVSVRSDEETAVLIAQLESAFAVRCHVARPAMALAGVRNGYEQYQRLGLDRWLAVVAAYQLAGGACAVIDLGTAVTADYVAADGEHMGGFICPGGPLLRTQLITHTRRTRYDAAEAEQALGNLSPGRSTAEAVERGCLLMLRGFVAGQAAMATQMLPAGHKVFLTGGDAALVQDVIAGATIVPDLVFIGLAIACPID